MGSLTMTEDEYNYYVDNIREAFKLIGQEAMLFQVDDEKKDLYWDANATYKDGRFISLIFEDNPKPVLKKFNWLIDDEETPYVCHIVALDDEGEPLEIRENMKISIKSKFGLKTNRFFNVSKVTGSSLDPLTFICKLTPWRFKIDTNKDAEMFEPTEKLERSETGFSYLRVEE